jgi:spoIIIJ-associated protein
MLVTKKTKETVSEAVKEFLKENDLKLNQITVNLISEKIFKDKKQYTLELAKKINNTNNKNFIIQEEEKQKIKSLLEKLLNLMYFKYFEINLIEQNNYITLKIKTNEKDGLLIGKNGQNIQALQFIFFTLMKNNLKKFFPVIVDIDSYQEKRNLYLKNFINKIADKLCSEKTEYITDFLPPYERKIIHEEISRIASLKTFSVGTGLYKKVVITSLL